MKNEMNTSNKKPLKREDNEMAIQNREIEPQFAYLAGYRKGDDVSPRGFKCMAATCKNDSSICCYYWGTDGEKEQQGEVLIRCQYLPERVER